MKVLSFLKNICLLVVMVTPTAFSQNYEISIEINSRNDTVFLAHYLASSNRIYPDDTTILKNGKGIFRGNRELAKGVYIVMSDSLRHRFDIIIGENQQFGIVADTVDLINRTKFTSSPENDIFYEFNQYNVSRGKQFQQLNEQYGNAVSDTERSTIRNKIQELRDERIRYIEKLIYDNSNLYVSKFLKTIIPPETYLPEPPKDEQGHITDSTYVYRWWRAHFFDNLNIYDPDMLRTLFYEEKLFDYITEVIPQHTDTICAEIDKILQKAQTNDEIYRFILVTVFNHYVNSKDIVRGYVVPENVWVHIFDKWYSDAPFSTAEYIEKMKEEIKKRIPNLIGKTAPPMEMLMALPPEHFKAAVLDTAIKFDLHAGKMIQDFRRELKSKYTVVLFWDCSCNSCRQTIQELFKVWDDFKNKGLQVITVQTVLSKEAKGKWIDFVNEHNLFGWTNAWSPYSYKYHELYNISAVPLIYLLDEKFNIIIKNIIPEQIKDFLDNQQL